MGYTEEKEINYKFINYKPMKARKSTRDKRGLVGEAVPEGTGNPLQYSCLGNPMDRGAWWAAVHGVTKSRTWLSAYTHTHTHTHTHTQVYNTILITEHKSAMCGSRKEKRCLSMSLQLLLPEALTDTSVSASPCQGGSGSIATCGLLFGPQGILSLVGD